MKKTRLSLITLVLMFSLSALLFTGAAREQDGIASERIFAEDHVSYIGLQNNPAVYDDREAAFSGRADLQKSSFAYKRHATSKKSRASAVSVSAPDPILHQIVLAESGLLPALPESCNGFYLGASGLSPPFPFSRTA